MIFLRIYKKGYINETPKWKILKKQGTGKG